MMKINNNSIVSSLIIISVLALGVLIPFAAHAQEFEVTPYHYGDFNSYGSPSYGGVTNPKPIIYLVNPSSLNRGSGATVVAITGNYFVPGAIAKWNGADRTTTFINSTYLQMQLTAGDTDVLGDFLVTVYNPTPGGGFSNPAGLRINGTQTNGAVPVNTPPPAANSASVSAASTTTTAPGVTVARRASTTPATATKTETAETDSADTKGLTAGAIFGLGSLSTFLPSSLIQWLLLFILVLFGVVLWRKIYLSDKEKSAPLKHH